ncbi:alpha/beta fold hydrolase [Parashewanella tropica]|uniref:alpha/beta fold hydrolase n=1 Tax=Parashewanella tropica TaxID=2547970 RepID=UPI0010595C19|nr:alpha/beta hydrolase [Parashewanella tropica]
MVNSKEIIIKLPHIRLAAKQWGESNKPIILALHGWLDNANSFESLAPFLSDYCIIAIDWPGHGHSQHRQDGYSLHLTDYVFDLELIISYFVENFTLDRVQILGHSFGGIIATIYSSLFPERVEKLILLDALLPLFEKENKARERLKRSIQQHAQLASSKNDMKHYSSIEVVAKARHKLTKLNYDSCVLLVSRNLTKSENGVIWHSDPKLKLDSAWRYSESQISSLIDKVVTPTLLILGKNSSYIQLETLTEKNHQYFDQLKIANCDGGHHLHMDSPKQVATHICSFIEQS